MAPATQLKLGLFAIVAVIAVIVVALALGLHARTPTVRYHTYFDESVYGLEVGSSVTFRGVRVGTVGDIAIAQDHRHIEVTLDLAEAQISSLDLPSVDARLDRAGITGVKFVNLEPRPAGEQPEQLAFLPAPRTISARRSTLTMLENRADRIARASTELMEHATSAMDSITSIVEEFRGEHVATQLHSLLDHADAAVGEVHRVAAGFDTKALSTKANNVLGHVDAAAGKLRDVLGHLDFGDDALQAIRDFGDAARSFRDFLDELQREPDILVKGRGRSGP